MNPNLEEIWVYLSTSPLLGLTLTLLAYQAAFWIYKRVGFHPLANPVLISVAILASLLLATGTPYQAYFDGAQFVHSCSARPPSRWPSRSMRSGRG